MTREMPAGAAYSANASVKLHWLLFQRRRLRCSPQIIEQHISTSMGATSMGATSFFTCVCILQSYDCLLPEDKRNFSFMLVALEPCTEQESINGFERAEFEGMHLSDACLLSLCSENVTKGLSTEPRSESPRGRMKFAQGRIKAKLEAEEDFFLSRGGSRELN
jgi:hypothetical protein